MTAHQLFQKMSPELGRQIVAWLRDAEKDVYKAALVSLTQQRNLRPVFIQKKSRDQQAAWMLETLKLRTTEAIGENVLQVWLLKGRAEMLASFLDGVGITHDGKGGVEGDLPATLDKEKVAAATAGLLSQHPAEEVAVYLHLFQLQQPGGWAEITGELEANPKLALGS
ncbi:MAG: hypothetical protein KA004_09665 [Verrucomicrobiales bacterium]|nr:hypothetical protein [Verrucomicrobiales bacterium]